MEGPKSGENNVAKKARLFSERSSPESNMQVSAGACKHSDSPLTAIMIKSLLYEALEECCLNTIKTQVDEIVNSLKYTQGISVEAKHRNVCML